MMTMNECEVKFTQDNIWYATYC